VWGTRRSIDAVEKAISAQSCVMSLRDEVMRLQIKLKAAEDRWFNSADNWRPGTYQNGA
jgi:hypothetical protein